MSLNTGEILLVAVKVMKRLKIMVRKIFFSDQVILKSIKQKINFCQKILN